MESKNFFHIFKKDFLEKFCHFLFENIYVKNEFFIKEKECFYFCFFIEKFGDHYLNNKIYINYITKHSKKYENVNSNHTFKFIIIYILWLWYKYIILYNENNDIKEFFVKENNKLNSLLKVIFKLYKDKIFNEKHIEILSKIFIILSICSREKKDLDNLNLLKNKEIQSFYLYTKSIQILNVFINKENLTDIELNVIENYLYFLRENITKDNIPNQLIIYEYNYKSTYSILGFLKLKKINEKIKKQLILLLLDIYSYKFNLDILDSFINIIKRSLINLSEKTIEEINNDLNLISMVTEYLRKEENPGVFENAFYLSGKNSGFIQKFSNLNNLSLYISFILMPHIIKNEYTLLSIFNSKNENIFKLSLKKIDNKKYETCFYLNQKKMEKKIEIEINKIYNLFINLNPFEIYYDLNFLKNKNNEKINDNIDLSNIEILIGNNKLNNEYISSFEGYIGDLIIYNINLDEEKIFDLLKTIKCLSINKNNSTDYFIDLENSIFNLNPINFNFYKIKEKIDFVELCIKNNISQKIDFKQFYSYLPYEDDKFFNNNSSFFNCYFRTINNEITLFTFINFDGIKFINLLFEYLYQVFITINNSNNINEITMKNM
jgi:hypothetical protein